MLRIRRGFVRYLADYSRGVEDAAPYIVTHAVILRSGSDEGSPGHSADHTGFFASLRMT